MNKRLFSIKNIFVFLLLAVCAPTSQATTIIGDQVQGYLLAPAVYPGRNIWSGGSSADTPIIHTISNNYPQFYASFDSPTNGELLSTVNAGFTDLDSGLQGLSIKWWNETANDMCLVTPKVNGICPATDYVQFIFEGIDFVGDSNRFVTNPTLVSSDFSGVVPQVYYPWIDGKQTSAIYFTIPNQIHPALAGSEINITFGSVERGYSNVPEPKGIWFLIVGLIILVITQIQKHKSVKC